MRYIDDTFFPWEYGEEKLRSFLNDINKIHPTVTFVTEWSKTSINFIDVTVSTVEDMAETDLFIKPTDSHQYLLSSFWYPFYLKKGISYSQSQTLNRSSSNNVFLDKRCNDLERGFNERMVRMEILQARYFPSNTLLGKVNNQKNNNEITFNITYHPVLRNVMKIL